MELSFQTILFIIAGVVVGWVLSFIKSRFEVAGYKKDIKQYQEHLNRQMKITNEGNKNLENDLEKLKKENENLRISIQTLGQKPGRAELRLLNIYDSTLRKMMMKAPGFSSAWEMALQEAETEYEASEKGFKSIIKKVFGPSLTQNSQTLPSDIAELPDGYESK
jgi:predicted RNase H-like nuclease (RuvC/YqgF family)